MISNFDVRRKGGRRLTLNGFAIDEHRLICIESNNLFIAFSHPFFFALLLFCPTHKS
jgi:hypothetical protein